MASLGSSGELSSEARDLTWSAPCGRTGMAASQHCHQVSGTLTTNAGIVPQLTYYSKVGLELGKLIVHQRGMAPP
jgi:F-type H+-transporting ATPase subunit g